jgi:hypothetical protein
MKSRVAHTAPVLLTLPATSALAQVGSQAVLCEDPRFIPGFDDDGNFVSGCSAHRERQRCSPLGGGHRLEA